MYSCIPKATFQFVPCVCRRPLENDLMLHTWKYTRGIIEYQACCIRYKPMYFCLWCWVKGHQDRKKRVLYDLKDEREWVLLTNMDDDDTHVFRCIDAVFTALPNICMLCCNLGSNKSRQLRELAGGETVIFRFTQYYVTNKSEETFWYVQHFHCWNGHSPIFPLL